MKLGKTTLIQNWDLWGKHTGATVKNDSCTFLSTVMYWNPWQLRN